ncbi:MAG: hypothetical protein KDD47_05255 [Acidobacteria bacterium]|nr:hypothetical protein [Acidobacteriota bacterium]
MRFLRQLGEIVHNLPLWGQVLLGLALVAFSAASVYGRINTGFGAKVFSKIPEEEIRTNTFHIIWYTVVPVLATIYFFVLVLSPGESGGG